MKNGFSRDIYRLFSGLVLLLLCFCRTGEGQTTDSLRHDSVVLKKDLSTVIVTAFEQSKRASDLPAALSYISTAVFNRYDDIDIVSAMNTVPGLRMEQRSPGSYRIDIRGSSLRSPFGVRNVKVYYNGMPLTDPGGNTYTNQLAVGDYGAVEVIKGPSASLYGAGIGGVILIKSALFSDTTRRTRGIRINMGAGSFGLKKGNVSLRWGKHHNRNELRYSEVKSDGYRDHTALHHQTLAYEVHRETGNKNSLDAFFHYTDLYYQTPGALTKQQFERNPRAARPASGIFPSAATNKASVHQKAFLTGIKNTYAFSAAFDNETVLYGAYTDFVNPTIRNYEFRKEPHFGGRTVFQYQHETPTTATHIWWGGEIQQGFFSQQDFENDRGNPDSLMTEDRINETTGFVFTQADFSFGHGWELNAGISLNLRSLHFKRLFPAHAADFTKKHPPIWAPRFVLSKKINKKILVFADISKGFSPPTVAEILPSTTILNKNLKAEKGIQYELGSKGYFLGYQLYYEIAAFAMQMSQSISLRRDSSGADYFVNAGGVNKTGLEADLHYAVYSNDFSFFKTIKTQAGLTLFDFTYKDYRSANKNYSGNKIPGSAPLSVTAGLDMETAIGINTYLTFRHTSKIPINNGNTVYSSSYNLLGLRLSYQRKLSGRIVLDLSFGGNNLLNEKYSLGDDINAYSGRYYNVAPAINFYGNIGINYLFKK